MTNNSINILHHVGVINKDLTNLATCYEKLGFLLTPVSTPKITIDSNNSPISLGVSNRHAIFRNNYLELLGITDMEAWSRLPKEKLGPYNIDRPLSRYEGLHVMHFGTNDIAYVKAQLTEKNISCSGIKQFQRNVLTSDGEKTMKAQSIFFPDELTPEGLVQVAQHDTPELVFQPQYMTHPNSALELTEITLCCEDIQECATRYSRITGHRINEITENCYSINLGYSRIRIVTPREFQRIVPDYKLVTLPFMAAFTVKTYKLDQARGVLRNNAVPFVEYNSSIIVGKEDAGGCAVIFI